MYFDMSRIDFQRVPKSPLLGFRVNQDGGGGHLEDCNLSKNDISGCVIPLDQLNLVCRIHSLGYSLIRMNICMNCQHNYTVAKTN